MFTALNQKDGRMVMATYDKARDDLGKDAPIWAHRINALLKEKNLTQEELAKESGISKATITIWFRGKKVEGRDTRENAKPRIETLRLVANVLEVPVEYLAGLSDSRVSKDEYKVGAEAFGLEDKPMKLLEAIKRRQPMVIWDNELVHIGNNAVSPALINYVLSNEHFWSGFDSLLSNYVRAKNENKRTHPSDICEIAAARSSLLWLFEKLIDGACDSLYKPKSATPLFDPNKKQKRRKKEVTP
jgi:transcriptional regulator with XRE-family HTH domain